jgi:hypothetical protein
MTPKPPAPICPRISWCSRTGTLGSNAVVGIVCAVVVWAVFSPELTEAAADSRVAEPAVADPGANGPGAKETGSKEAGVT